MRRLPLPLLPLAAPHRPRSARRSPRARALLLPLLLPALLAGCTGKPGAERGPQTEADQAAALPPIALRLTDDEATPRAPLALTASDGTGLRLLAMTARAVVDEPLAFTELHLVFENPEDRTIEGRFEIEMPPHAAISRFAMKVHGSWQEGEVVERQAARVAYEDFLHRKQDPALLENNAGNAFSARVFPIGPRERKELIVSYSQELPSSAEPYRLMLRGLPELERLDAQILVREATTTGDASNLGGATTQTRVVELQKSHYLAERDLEIGIAGDGRVRSVGLRHENLALARIAPDGAIPPAAVGSLTVLFDTSASRALGFERQIRRLAAVITDLQARSGEDFDLRIVGFDQSTAELFRGKASAFGQADLDRIASRRALGASDLEGALRSLAAIPRENSRLLVISDGIATAGGSELSRLREAMTALAAAGYRRADAIVDGGIQDTSTLKAITTADLPDDGVVIDSRLPSPTIAHKLNSATLPPLKVEVPGARWVWPETIEGAQPGDELLVFADLPAERAFTVTLAGAGIDTIEAAIPSRGAERPLLERAWVRARIARLADERSRLPEGDVDMREALRASIIDLSTKHRVLSDFTALLVLETEWDYQRFNIDRRALAQILSVGPGGITLDGRTSRPPTPPLGSPPEPEGGQLYAMRGPGTPDPGASNPQWALPSEPQGGPVPESAASGHFLASPYGGAFALGNDDDDVWGGLTGTEVGESFGVGGLGLVGTGRGGGGVAAKEEEELQYEPFVAPASVGPFFPEPSEDSAGDLGLVGTGRGGGGTGEGTIGLGNIGLIGKGGGGGSGTRTGYGRGAGAGFGGRGARIPIIRQGKAQVQGALDRDIIRRIVRAHINEVRHCYNQGLARNPNLKGRITVQFVVGGTGRVTQAVVAESSLPDHQVGVCISQAIRRWTFPQPQGGGSVTVTYPFALEADGGTSGPYVPPTPEELAAREAALERQRIEAERQRIAWEAESKRREAEARARAAEEERTKGSPYRGRFFDVDQRINASDPKGALAIALEWQSESPGDVLALVALGQAAEAAGDPMTAARAYGSLIDLFPARADLRRFAGNHLERLGDAGLPLAIDTYAQAVESRPDHPASHRLYALALARSGAYPEAWAAIQAGRDRTYPAGRFAGVTKILDDDAGLIAAAWIAARPKEAAAIEARATAAKVTIPKKPSTHFVITWETDANDVDFHIHDGKGGHAYFGNKRLRSGGQLYADVTTGYGPESFTIEGEPQAFPYRLEAHYYSRGPMGYGMGKLQIIHHDGKGGLSFDERPYLIMKDRAFLPLGTYEGPGGAPQGKKSP